MTPRLVPAGALFMCGNSGCDATRYLRCPDCGWTCIALEDEPEDDNGQLALDVSEPPAHTELDCRRIQREHPKPEQLFFRSRRARQAYEAYKRIHSKHAPARMTVRHGTPVCPTCGFRP